MRYHDAAATEYDAKWGIDFGSIGRDQVRGKLVKALGSWPGRPFGDALEIGSGTGYFSLNLVQMGAIDRLVATDISPGMLSTLSGTADRLGIAVETEVIDAESPAVRGPELRPRVRTRGPAPHPRPGPGAPGVPARPSARRGRRVLRRAFALRGPAGGGAQARRRARGALWRLALGASARRPEPESESDGHELEPEVDVHAFTPSALNRMLDAAGFEDVRIVGEELLANAFGWTSEDARGLGGARRGPDAVAEVRISRLPGTPARGHHDARAEAAAFPLLQPGALRAKARRVSGRTQYYCATSLDGFIAEADDTLGG